MADLFGQLNNAVLDLQASEHQTYERPLKVLGRLIRHEDLADINARLKQRADYDAFIAASEATQGGMVGSAKLEWPEDPEAVLGLTIMLIEKFADDPNYAISFCHQFFYSKSIVGGLHGFTRQVLIPFMRDYKSYVQTPSSREVRLARVKSNKVFIVHGHDEGAREVVARFLSDMDFKPIILHEQANLGRTVIEKVEAHGDVGFAVVLLTPDDEGSTKGSAPQPRARQNVVLELGYFIGRLGREHVCALKRGELEIPSDFGGVVYEPFDAGNGWKLALARELKAAGHEVDLNKVMSP